jgi:hypothetical protein
LSASQNGGPENNGSMRGMDVRPQPRGGGSWI